MPFDGSQLDDVTKLLIEGRGRIERGWCQGRFEAPGAVCMLGAIRWNATWTPEAEARLPTTMAARNRLSDAIGMRETDRAHIPYWNDAPGRTKDEVLAAFDKAIAQIT